MLTVDVEFFMAFSFLFWLRMNNNAFLKILQKEENVSFAGKPFKFPTKKRTIHIKSTNEDVVDNAFFCIGQTLTSFGGFYVSEEYDVNLLSEDRLPGRFIFMLGTDNDQWKVVYLLATAGATVITDVENEVEELYLQSRQDEKENSGNNAFVLHSINLQSNSHSG